MTTILETDRLILRNWEDRDRGLFHRINSDETVMAFFPMRRTRAQSDALMDELREDVAADGFGFMAAEIRDTGETIGFVGLSRPHDLGHSASGTIEIGWRLAPEHWGFGYATEAARAWIDFGFRTLDVPEIVAFAVPDNARSIAVMRRLGMRADPARDFDHPAVPDSHPHLRRHAVYVRSRADWLADAPAGAS